MSHSPQIFTEAQCAREGENYPRRLVTDCMVLEVLPGTSDKLPKHMTVKGLWDTGATNTAISRRVVEELGLKPRGKCWVSTASGIEEKPAYYIAILLDEGKMSFGTQFRVTEAHLNEKGSDRPVDVLIGMDVISQGDFAVTTHLGVTKVSFRVPSCGHVEFAVPRSGPAEIRPAEMPPPGVNSLCPCKSGKPYGECHGRAAS